MYSVHSFTCDLSSRQVRYQIFIMFRQSLCIFALLQCSVLVILQVSAECDITKCNIPKHYREIGCEPSEYAKEDTEKCCPIKYNCDAIQQQNATNCHFRGKSFSDGDRMEEDVNCRASCYCREGQFTCAHIECPEEVFNRPEPHCVVQKSRDKCCSESILCDTKEIEQLSSCYMDGKQYRQGEKMYPAQDRCFSCICDEKFDNSTEVSRNPSCNEVDCSIELDHLQQIKSGCVPVYFGEPTCCPIATKCRKWNNK